MTIEVLSVYTRPSPDIAWHEPIMLTKKLTKKYGSKRTSMMVDSTDFVLKVKTVWESAEVREAFEQEPEIVQQFAAIKEYHESVGIIAEPKIVTEEI